MVNLATCFIFTRAIDLEQCLSLRIDEHGEIDAPLALRSIQELQLLQINARTVVVLPSESSSLHEIELPWLADRKARAAIPYALEEQLAQSVTTLHFSFDRQHYQNNRYLVAVTDKPFLVELIAKFDALNLHFDILTLDWFALKEGEACVTEHGILINEPGFKGALNGELATIYLSSMASPPTFYTFNDSMPLVETVNPIPSKTPSSVWIAQRLLHAHMVNLCQGDLQHDTGPRSCKQWYQASGILLGALIASIFIFKGFYLHSLTTRSMELDKKIAVVYRQFFPDASQVTSPKFRIEQLLKSGLATGDTAVLRTLLDQLASAMKGSDVTIEQFHFQRRVLSVALVSKNFSALESLQLRLQQANVKVTQSQATSHEHDVAATLELSL